MFGAKTDQQKKTEVNFNHVIFSHILRFIIRS